MAEATTFDLTGHAGRLFACRWSPESAPRYVTLLVHGYGEHLGRYEWVADRLVADGGVVYALDHVGHGRSDGERVLIDDVERVVDDVHLLAQRAAADHPGLPTILLGHSMGGLIGARYGQRHGRDLAALILTGAVMGRWDALDGLLSAPEIPDAPIDPATLSRDPSVGAAYVADPLVWHGPFKRTTLEALQRSIATIAAAGPITDVPVLWLHGADDHLVPYAGSAQGWATLGSERGRAKAYPDARHEILNETNRDEVMADVLAFVREHVGP